MHKSILLVYDGSPEGLQALLDCADLERFRHVETHLLAIMQIPSGPFSVMRFSSPAT